MKTEKIISNRIQCKLCGEVLESFKTHDMKWCHCGAVGVDGGHSYLKRAWDPKAFEEVGVSRATQKAITEPNGIYFDDLSEVEEIERPIDIWASKETDKEVEDE